MGRRLREFVGRAGRLQRRYAGRPRQEMVRLFLLALEREEIVSVGYREAMIVRRLAAMPIGPRLRELIRHALPGLGRTRRCTPSTSAARSSGWAAGRCGPGRSLRQVAGAVGGWSSSVRQHVRWSAGAAVPGPGRRSITGVGLAPGKVPRDVRQHLRYGPFRDFCLFNVDAEQTARLCWRPHARAGRRAARAAPRAGRRLPPHPRRRGPPRPDLQILADVARRAGPARAGRDAPTRLAGRIGAVGEDFLPRDRRAAAGRDHPLGSGGRGLGRRRGESPEEQAAVFRRLLDDAGLADRLARARAGTGQAARRAARGHQADLHARLPPQGSLAHHRPGAARRAGRLPARAGLRRRGGRRGAQHLRPVLPQPRGVARWPRYFGFASPRYRLVDLSEEQVPHAYGRGMAQYTVGRTWKEADFRISFGKMRSHPVELVAPDASATSSGSARAATSSSSPSGRPTARRPIMMLLDDFPPHFALLDAYDSAADGLVGRDGLPAAARRRGGSTPAPMPWRWTWSRRGTWGCATRASRASCGPPATGSATRPTGLEVVGVDEPSPAGAGRITTTVSTLLSFLAYPVYVRQRPRHAVRARDGRAGVPAAAARGAAAAARPAGVRRLLGLRHPR